MDTIDLTEHTHDLRRPALLSYKPYWLQTFGFYYMNDVSKMSVEVTFEI
jgi:hypothetical protein